METKIKTAYRTDHNGAGYILARGVVDGTRRQFTKPYDHGQSIDANHCNAARLLVAKRAGYSWAEFWISGSEQNDRGFVFTVDFVGPGLKQGLACFGHNDTVGSR